MAQHKNFRVLRMCAAGQQSQPSQSLPKDQIQQSYRHDRRSCPTTTVQRCRSHPPWIASSVPTPPSEGDDSGEEHLVFCFVDRVLDDATTVWDGYGAPWFSLFGRAAAGQPGVLGDGDGQGDDAGELVDRQLWVSQSIRHNLGGFDRPELIV